MGRSSLHRQVGKKGKGRDVRYAPLDPLPDRLFNILTSPRLDLLIPHQLERGRTIEVSLFVAVEGRVGTFGSGGEGEGGAVREGDEVEIAAVDPDLRE
jgi:hypothetical protein